MMGPLKSLQTRPDQTGDHSLTHVMFKMLFVASVKVAENVQNKLTEDCPTPTHTLPFLVFAVASYCKKRIGFNPTHALYNFLLSRKWKFNNVFNNIFVNGNDKHLPFVRQLPVEEQQYCI